MIHRFTDLLEVQAGLIPMTLWSVADVGGGDESVNAVWLMSTTPGQDPYRICQYRSNTNDDDITDAVINSDLSMVVYCETSIGAGTSRILRLDAPFTPPTSGLGTQIATNTSTLVASMHPSFNPADPDLVVYRTMDDSPNECEIRTVIPSVGSSSVDSLITKTRSGGDNVIFPRFNFDGSRIAYGYGDNIRVMDADGTNDASLITAIGNDVQSGLDFAWSPVADELAYSKISGGSMTICKINGDGTGNTVLYTDPATAFWGLNLYPWSPDGSALYYFQRDEALAPRFSMWVIDAASGGGAQVSPQKRSYGSVPDHTAYVFGSRVYWSDFPPAGELTLKSVALDGSDERDEFVTDGTTPGPITDFVSGFYYRLSSPS